MIFSQSFLISFAVDTKKVYFNNNNFPSDLNGRLQGNVLYAQSQIVPQTINIKDDVQPKIVSQRHTLVLFKLISPNPNSSKVIMSVKNSQGVTKLEEVMDPPKNIIGNVKGLKPGTNLNFDSIDNLLKGDVFNVPGNKLSCLDNPNAECLKEYLDKNNVIVIYTYDGRWAKNFYLPQGNYEGKTVIAISNAGYSSNFISNRKSMGINRGNRIQTKMIDGDWWFETEKIHDSYRYGSYWTYIIPYMLVEDGMEVSFKLDDLSGSVKPELGGPSQLLLNTIDLGLLTEPRNSMTLGTDRNLQREYFLTIPAAEMLVVQYETIEFFEVKMPWGDLYTLPNGDPSDGGVYSGNMRQNTAKVLISHGIDNANYGWNSSVGSNEGGHPFISAELTAHHSVGLYKNGRISHGLSGGNGMVTLSGNAGNEISHEFGHNYGLGHYYGGGKYCIHRPAHEHNSTWGWDNYNNYFIPNFASWEGGQMCNSGSCVDPFTVDGKTFSFGRDAMAGGYAMWDTCRFTLYTPYTMKRIQDFFESKAIFDVNSPTGFSKWSKEEKKIIAFENKETVLSKYNVNFLKNIDLLKNFHLNDITVQSITDLSPKNTNYYIPKPKSCTIGKILEFNHDSSPVTIDIGSEKINLEKGSTVQIFSDGNVWKVLKTKKSDVIVHTPLYFGIPVVVLVGYYDAQFPYTRGGFIFPGLYGSHGYVYPNEVEYIPTCRLVVKTTSEDLIYLLRSSPFNGNLNKFHVAIPRSKDAKKAEIYCGSKLLVSSNIQPPKELTAFNRHGKNCDDISNKEICQKLEKK